MSDWDCSTSKLPASAFPHGSSFEHQHSWGSEILSWLEQESLYRQIDFEKFWSDPDRNGEFVFTDLAIFHCPSSLKTFAGRTDYCGISGSYRAEVGDIENNGMLFSAVAEDSAPVEMRSVTDGTSQTIMVAEGATVMELDFGFWACGLNCFGHEEGGVNEPGRPSDEIVGDHPGGANAVFCDGSVHFLGQSLDPDTVAALCTRNGYESINEF